jgi:hypothetical protein
MRALEELCVDSCDRSRLFTQQHKPAVSWMPRAANRATLPDMHALEDLCVSGVPALSETFASSSGALECAKLDASNLSILPDACVGGPGVSGCDQLARTLAQQQRVRA